MPTLIRLLALAFLVIGALFLRSLMHGDRKVDTYYAALRADLRMVARAQSAHLSARRRYARSLDSLAAGRFGNGDLHLSEGVRITITHADEYRWEAVATHTQLPTRCVYRDTAPPRSVPSFSDFRRFCESPP
ncbi:MAG TPA: hypothetical protein VGA02_05720 [Gemmatimonadales bacterium]|jgi:hypothetical protein